MAEHTPGPWVARAASILPEREISADVQGKDGQFVADCGSHERSTDNARLIAAAPKMGAFLLSCYQHVSHGGPTRGELEDLLREAGLLPPGSAEARP